MTVKAWAHLQVQRAVQAGVLVRPEACEGCDRTGQRLAGHHHKGYEGANILNVVWLCSRCHNNEHPRGRNAAVQLRPFVPDVPGTSDAPHPRRRRHREVETPAYVAFARRILRALSRRVGADLDGLRDLVALRDEVDGTIADAVARLRNDPDIPASWGEIAEVLGQPRSTVSSRYSKAGGARQPGGQPSHLR